MTRFLMRATYGDVRDEKQADVLARNRRIGVGHLGFASFCAKAGVRFSDSPQTYKIVHTLEYNAMIVDLAAREYAHALRIPVPVKKRTVAPTGTIAKMPGVSEGIHPIFAKYFIRRVRFSTIDPEQRDTCLDLISQGYAVEDDRYADNTMVVSIPTKDSLMQEVEDIYGRRKAEEIVQSAADLTLAQMLKVQAMYQRYWADNAVSFTANVNPMTTDASAVFSDLMTYGVHLKGATVFPEMSMPQAPYERITKEEYEAYENGSVADGVDENCANGACPVK
jgi:adenosylcobalamin-dependent ribonucleoside-triphosphate reductase